MNIYLLSITAEPTKTAVDFEKLKSAFIECWVHSDSTENAKALAASRVMDFSWTPKNVECVHEIPVELLHDCDTELQACAKLALQKKVHLIVVGVPRHEENQKTVEYRPFKTPFDPSDQIN